MPVDFKRIKWAKPPIANTTNQVTLVLTDGRTFTRTKAQLATLNTEAKMRTALTTALGMRNDIFLHLNRNGRWCIAIGAAPAVWPEDEPIV